MNPLKGLAWTWDNVCAVIVIAPIVVLLLLLFVAVIVSVFAAFGWWALPVLVWACAVSYFVVQAL